MFEQDSVLQEKSGLEIEFFDEAKESAPSEVGGKGSSLIRLTQIQIPVPTGFCLSTKVYQQFLVLTGLEDKIYELLQTDDPLASAEKIANLFTEVCMPAQIRGILQKAYAEMSAEFVAVRSSAVEEDSDDASFAGQHSTFLFIRGLDALCEAVQDCWASLWSRNAIAYRQEHSEVLKPLAMAVVVQQIADGDCSGVAFGRHPIDGDERSFVVESCYGLGEGLVSGRVSSDRYIIDKKTGDLVESQIVHKVKALKYNGSQIDEIAIDQSQRNEASLPLSEIPKLFNLLEAIESFYECPQDVEWTYKQGKFYILQSRPITTDSVQPDDRNFYMGDAGRDVEENILWSRMDIGEIFTGRLSTLGVSFAKHYQYKVHGDCGDGLGLLDRGLSGDYMSYYKGHVYLNVAYTAYLLAQTPTGYDQWPFLKRFTSEEVDLEGYQNPYGTSFDFSKKSKSTHLRYWVKKNLAELFSAKKRAKQMAHSRFKEFDRVMAQDITQFDLTQLREEINHALDYFYAMHKGYLPFYINAFAFYGVLEELCNSWLGDEGTHIQNELKGDMSNLRTLESARDIWVLCQKLDNYPELKRTFSEGSLDDIKQYLEHEFDGQNYVKNALGPFMRENGVRAHQEMELTNPRWIDDPDYVFQMIKTYLSQGYAIEERLSSNSKNREGKTDELMKKLSLSQRLILKRVMKLYCGCSQLRENTRMSMITSIWLVRRVIYEVGRRMVSEGILNNLEEVRYMDFNNILEYVYGYEESRTAFKRADIERNMALYHSYRLQDEPPLTFIGYANTLKNTPQSSDSDVNGLGTSAGIVEGRARVISDVVMQATELNKGEIIITEYTDASWSPLFSIAGGIVTDVGSMLSHSSIVAREFGIPSVVNTKNATQKIKTGDLIRVDGSLGSVTFWENENETHH